MLRGKTWQVIAVCGLLQALSTACQTKGSSAQDLDAAMAAAAPDGSSDGSTDARAEATIAPDGEVVQNSNAGADGGGRRRGLGKRQHRKR